MSVELHFVDEDRVVTGEPGQTLLEVAQAHGIDLDHACGGVCACATCHVQVEEGAALLDELAEEEEDQLDLARGVSLASRLGCQARIRAAASGRIRVVIPAWNTNFAREAH